MSTAGARFAAAAQALEGTAFRLHGRSPATGLDCVGLVGASLEACGHQPVYPSGYRLRNQSIAHLILFAERNGLRPATGPLRPGDTILTCPGPAQRHLLVALGGGRFAHAHAGLRKVVVQHLDLDDPPLAQWRLDPEPEAIWQP